MSNWCPACSFFCVAKTLALRIILLYHAAWLYLHLCIFFCWATQVRVRLATRLVRCPERQTRVRIAARSLAAHRAEPLWTAAAAVRSSLAASSIPTTSARASAAPTRTCCGYWFSCVNIKSYRSHLSRNQDRCYAYTCMMWLRCYNSVRDFTLYIILPTSRFVHARNSRMLATLLFYLSIVIIVLCDVKDCVCLLDRCDG